MKKKLYLTSICFMLVLLLITGCGKNKETAKEKGNETNQTENFTTQENSDQETMDTGTGETKDGTNKEIQRADSNSENVITLSDSDKAALEYFISRLDYVLTEKPRTTKTITLKDMSYKDKMYLVTLFFNDKKVAPKSKVTDDGLYYQESKGRISKILKRTIGSGLVDSKKDDIVNINLGDYGDGVPIAQVLKVEKIKENQVKITGVSGLKSSEGKETYSFEAAGTKTKNGLFAGYILNKITFYADGN